MGKPPHCEVIFKAVSDVITPPDLTAIISFGDCERPTNTLTISRVVETLPAEGQFYFLSVLQQNVLNFSSESLPDVEILANINFWFNANQSLFSWEEYGFKLHVPRKSTANFKVRVVELNMYELPEGTELLSPFYWVTSEGDTAGPVGIEIQHCCGRIAKERLSGMGFAMHKVFNEKSGPSRPFEEVRGQLSNSDGYAAMKVDFSDRILALFTRLKRSLHLERRYQAKLYYYNEPSVMTTCVAHIVIAPDVNACQVSEKFNSYASFVSCTEICPRGICRQKICFWTCRCVLFQERKDSFGYR